MFTLNGDVKNYHILKDPPKKKYVTGGATLFSKIYLVDNVLMHVKCLICRTSLLIGVVILVEFVLALAARR